MLLKKDEDQGTPRCPRCFRAYAPNPEYPDTLNVKMYTHVRPPGLCPHFELEPSDHLLSREYYDGTMPERVKEIMMGRVRDAM